MKAITRITHRVTAALCLLAFASTSALAALPAAVAPSNAPAAGNWLELIKGYVKDGGVVLGLTVSVLGFIWIAYTGISKFNEARNGKAEWAEVGLLGIVGGALLLFVTYLLTEAAAVI
ncbi:MAG: TIGR03745 family integrating conjugative element membrane protein [Candidatus Sedimenticola sp. (ex Thyasira tokunagai)]